MTTDSEAVQRHPKKSQFQGLKSPKWGAKTYSGQKSMTSCPEASQNIVLSYFHTFWVLEPFDQKYNQSHLPSHFILRRMYSRSSVWYRIPFFDSRSLFCLLLLLTSFTFHRFAWLYGCIQVVARLGYRGCNCCSCCCKKYRKECGTAHLFTSKEEE
jgi:hypothetical protein